MKFFVKSVFYFSENAEKYGFCRGKKCFEIYDSDDNKADGTANIPIFNLKKHCGTLNSHEQRIDEHGDIFCVKAFISSRVKHADNINDYIASERSYRRPLSAVARYEDKVQDKVAHSTDHCCDKGINRPFVLYIYA